MRSPLCDLIGIDVPIIQAGMSIFTSPARPDFGPYGWAWILMLAGEPAMGEYPVESVAYMHRIACVIEPALGVNRSMLTFLLDAYADARLMPRGPVLSRIRANVLAEAAAASAAARAASLSPTTSSCCAVVATRPLPYCAASAANIHFKLRR